MTTTLINPTTGAALREVPSTSAAETDAAIERAHEAFASWRSMAPGERARLLRAFAAVVDAHNEELARLEVENSGHTIGNARWEAGNVRDCLNYYSAAPTSTPPPMAPSRTSAPRPSSRSAIASRSRLRATRSRSAPRRSRSAAGSRC